MLTSSLAAGVCGLLYALPSLLRKKEPEVSNVQDAVAASQPVWTLPSI
jgi:hypothetical protein